ncbi:hypothetical protein, partial [Streptococcus sp.]|uniref:hypothetical protein n=1 Tax=Streptococcus sp. TaxID=1306 RepID=UPI002589232C
KSSIISTVELPTIEIIEPFFLMTLVFFFLSPRSTLNQFNLKKERFIAILIKILSFFFLLSQSLLAKSVYSGQNGIEKRLI